MSECSHVGPNGQKSILAQQLLDTYQDPAIRDRVMTYIYSEQFKEKYGDWTDEFDPTSPPVDNIAKEPLLAWLQAHIDIPGTETPIVWLKLGMKANEGQTALVKNVTKFLERGNRVEGMDPRYKDLYLVEGGAGVGKTTAINRALENFRGSIIGATVSDEARSILQLNMIGKNTLTIAKLLGLVADKTGEKLIFRERNAFEEAAFRKRGMPDPIETADLVVLDEASMVDNKTWDLLMKLKPAHTKIIFLGDRTQLPPIGEALSRVFSTLQATPNYSKLTEVMRFQEGAPIFQVTERLFADNIRNSQETGAKPEYNPLVGTPIEDVIANGEATLYRAYHDGLITDIATEFKNATGNKDVIVIADMNKSVENLNNQIRNKIFDGDTKEPFKVGERVRMASPYVVDKQVVADNNLKGTVMGKKEGVINELPVIQMEIEFEKVTIMGEIKKEIKRIPIIKPGHEAEFKTILENLRQRALKNKSEWRNFYDFKDAFGVIDYAYAMTVHKVQGSTYKTVYVMENEIYRYGTPRTALEVNQMMRTATSRPTTKLVIVTSKTTDVSTTLIDIPGKPVIEPVVTEPEPIEEPEPVPEAPAFHVEPAKETDQKIFTEFGTEYRFEVKPGVIFGEYRQKGKNWLPMNVKQAKAKYKQFHTEKIEEAEVVKDVPSINIYAGTNENAELSNFATRPFTVASTQLEYKETKPITLTEPKSRTKPSERMSIVQLKEKIKTEILDIAEKNPDTFYKVAYTDMSSRYGNNTGYTTREYAYTMDEMREEGLVPSNVGFTPTFEGSMNNSPTQIRKAYQKLIEDQQTRVRVNMDGKIIQEQLSRMLIPLVDQNGTTVKLYDEVEQAVAAQSVMGLVYKATLDMQADTPVSTIMRSVLSKLQSIETALKAKGFEEMAHKYTNIIRAFSFTDPRPSFARMVIENMNALGYKIDESKQQQLFNYLDKEKTIYTAPENTLKIDGTSADEVVKHIEETESDLANEEVDSTIDKDSSRGRGSQDWSDVSFQIDQRDTASTRMKMFMSTIDESDYGRYQMAGIAEEGIDFSKISDVSKLTIEDALKANNKKIWHPDAAMRTKIVEYLKSNFEVVPLRNSLKLTHLVDLDSLFENTTSTLASQSNRTFDNYIKLLQESRNPNLKALYKALTKADQQLKNEFVKVMTKQYNPFLMVMSKVKTDALGNEFNEVRLVNAQRGSQIQNIIKEWQEYNKLSPMMKVREDGTRVLDAERAKNKHMPLIRAYDLVFNKLSAIQDNEVLRTDTLAQIQEELNKFNYPGTAQQFANDAVGDRTWMKDHFKKVFNTYGIELDDNMLESLFGRRDIWRKIDGEVRWDGKVDNLEGLTKGSTKAGNLGHQFRMTQNGEPIGIFSSFFTKAAGQTSKNDAMELDLEAGEEQATLNNPLHTEGTAMYILGKIVAQHTPVLHSSTHNSVDGKSIWDYSHNTSLSKSVQDFKADFASKLGDLLETDLISSDKALADGSWYLRQWAGDGKALSRFQLYYLDGLKFGGRENGVNRSKMSDREQILTSVLAFQNKGQLNGHFMSLTHSDKTMTPMFYGVPKLGTGVQTLNLEVLSELRNLFNAEHRRISKQSSIPFNDKAYDEGKKHFFFLPQFNKEALMERAKEGKAIKDTNIKLTPELISKLWLPNGTITNNTTDETLKKVINGLLLEHVDELTANTKASWKENGITSSLLDRTVVSNITTGLGGALFNATEEEIAQREDAILEIAARDYAFNHFLWNTNMSMLFYGDPAQLWKNSVEDTMKDYAKRLAKDIAPGQDLAFEPDAHYNTLTLTDVEPAETYITNLGIANKSVGTDAQELTTTKEHLDVMYASGLIPVKKYEELLKVIDDAKGGYYEFTKEQLNIVLQPMKPVYAGFRAPVYGAMLVDYVKSSSYPLLPQFTKDLDIDEVRKLMEDPKNNIQRAYFKSAKKIGIPTKTATLFDSKGKFQEKASWIQAKQTLSRNGFRIQQDVPYDEGKEEIKIVSQMHKLITEGTLDMTENFVFPDGREFTPAQLRTFKEDIRKSMMDLNIKKLFDRLNTADKSGKIDKKLISQLLVEEAKSRGYSKNEIDVLNYMTEKGEFEVPIFLHSSADKFESLVMSLVRKLTETKIPGKSYVQASSVGYTRNNMATLDSVDKTGIVWVGDYDGNTPLRHQQLVDGKVIPAQVILPFNFFLEDGTRANIQDYTNTDPITEKKTIDFTKVPRELLQLIGARIPNQGHNSMIALEIVGFTHESMGDLMIVPSAITGQMGSDFDVDKIYTYKRPYVLKNGKFQQDIHENLGATPDDWVALKGKTKALMTKEGIKPDAKGQYPDFNKYLAKAVEEMYPDGNIPRHRSGKKDLASLQTDYFDVHWSVLTSPQMYTKVLSPLDKQDLSEMNSWLKAKNSQKFNYYDPVSQLKDFQSGKDAKALVGMTSLSVTFNAVIQDKNIRLGVYNHTKDDDGNFITEEIPTPIEVVYGLDKEGNPEKLSLVKLSGNGKNNYFTPGTKVPQIRTKHDNLTTFQTGAVDNARYRTLDNLNITMATYPAIAAMHLLETEDGKIINVDFSSALLTQQIMWEFSREMRQGNDSLSVEYAPDLRGKVIMSLHDKYKKAWMDAKGYEVEDTTDKEQVDKWEDEFSAAINEAELSPEKMKAAWNQWQNGTDMTNADYVASQLTFLGLFQRFADYGERLGILQKTFNQDTNGAGPNVIYAMQQQENYLNTYKEGKDKILLGEDGIGAHGTTEQGYMFQKIIPAAIEIMKELYPISAIQDTVNYIAAQSNRTLNEVPIKTQREIIKSIRAYALTTSKTFGNHPEVERARLLFGTNDQQSLAIRVENAKRANPTNYFLQRLQTEISIMGKGPDFITYQNAKTIRLDEEKNVNAFMSLLNNTDPAIHLLAEDLIRYTYLLSPQNDAQSFIKHVPSSYLAATSFAEDMRQAQGSMEKTLRSDRFRVQLYQHKPTLSLQIAVDIFGKHTTVGQAFPEMFMVSTEEHKELQTGDKENPTIDFVHYRDKTTGQVVLYRLKSSGTSAIYQRIDTLGKGTKTEYNATSDGMVRSLFSENRALQSWNNTISIKQALINSVNRSIAFSENPSNHYANWEVPAVGSMLDMNHSLRNMGDDTNLPQWYRTVANTLVNSSQTQEEIEALESISFLSANKIGKPFQVKIVPDLDASGEYDPTNRVLSLKPTGDKILAAETVLHELSHQRTAAISIALGHVNTRTIEQLKKFDMLYAYNNGVAEFKKNNPKLDKLVSRLDEIRYEAITEFKKRYNALGYDTDQIFDDISRGIATSSLHEIAYGLHNMAEFLAHVWTNKEVMNFLNTVESKGNRTIVDRIWDTLIELLSQLSEFLGKDINQDGLLKEAFMLTYRLNNLAATEDFGMNIVEEALVPTTMVVHTEAKAQQMADFIESTYEQQVTVEATPVEFKINITDKKIARTDYQVADKALAIVIEKMRKEVEQLNGVLSLRVTDEETKERYLRALKYRTEVNSDIQEMISHQNSLRIGELAIKQLKWVEEILDKNRPNIHETILAMTILDTWRNLNQAVYNEDITEINEDFSEMIAKVQGKADAARNRLMTYARSSVQALARQRGMDITPEDLGINLKDMDSASQGFITLSRNYNKAVQLLTSVTQEAANNTDEEMVRLRNRLNALEKLVQNSGMKKEDLYNKLIQTSTDGKTWGLIQPLSADWYRLLSTTKSTLRGILYGANTSGKDSGVDKNATKREGFKAFWTKMNEKAVVVPIAKFLDPTTGILLSEEKYEEARQLLLGICNNEEVVDKAIQKSIDTYRQYLEAKSQALHEIEDMTMDEELAKISLSAEQEGTLNDAEKATELKRMREEELVKRKEIYRLSWIAHNSPISFEETQSDNVGNAKLQHTLEYTSEFIPRNGSKLFDTAYADVQDNAKLKEIYEEFVDLSSKYRAMLPPVRQERLHDNFLPIVTSSDISSFFGIVGGLSASKVGQKVFEAFTASQADKDRVHKNEIPIDFITRGNIPVSDLSRDLPKIFEMFGNMAIHFKNMREVQDTIETVQMLVDNEISKRTDNDKHKPLNNLSDSIQAYKEMLVFKKAKNLEMVSETPRYSLNPIENARIEKRILVIKKELEDIGEQRMDAMENGDDSKTEEMNEKSEKLNAELNGYLRNARYFTGSKAADVLIGINQLKALSYNPFSAVNNLVFGTMAAFIHAYGRVDYTPKELRWGFKTMKGSVGKSITFGMTSPGEATKIHNIMDRIGVISEVLDTMYGKSNLSTHEKSMLQKTLSPYAWQKSGDYLHKGAMVLAMMKHTMVEVEVDGIKKEISLYEALDDNGEWNVEKYGENKQWSSDDINEQKSWNKFRDKTRKVSIIVHGNQDKNAPLMAKRSMWGRLLGQFRASWLSEGVNTRFGKGGFDEQLGREVKGRFRTYGELGPIQSAMVLAKQCLSIITKADPFAGVTNRKGQELTDTDKENMRKNIAGLAYTMAFIAAMMLVKGLGPSEEERRRRKKKGQTTLDWNRTAYNMLTRSYQDLMLYASPSVFDQVTGNALPATTVISDAIKAIKAVGYLPFDDRKDAGMKAARKVARAIPFANLWPKIEYMMSRDLSTAAR